MSGRRLGRYGLAALLCLVALPVWAQFSPPPTPKPTGATLFRNHCATCHALDASAPPRQGPNLAHVIGRQAGSVAGFHYSAGFAKAGFIWDADHLNAYLTNPDSVIPGAAMPIREANPDIRAAIIDYLKEQS
jgi:cytochrome c